MKETILTTLRHHPFVAEFEPRHVEKLAAMAKQIRFERDQIIFREGDECSEFYLIVTGLVSLEIAAPGAVRLCRHAAPAGRRCRAAAGDPVAVARHVLARRGAGRRMIAKPFAR